MDWNIQSRAHRCHECEKAFGDREVVHTVLFTGKEGLERVDVCRGCWEGQLAEGANHRLGFISHWQSLHVVPPPPTEVIQRESAETLLRKLIDRGRPEEEAASFVLAVMLERKRILRMQGRSVGEGRRLMHYEHVPSGDVLTVAEVDLHLDQLEAVQQRVSELLEHGLPAEPGARSAEAAAETEPRVEAPGKDASGGDEPAEKDGGRGDEAVAREAS